MAKRYSPFPLADLPDGFKKVVRAFVLRGQPVAVYNAEMPTPSPEWLAEQTELYNNAVAAWNRLKTWKKTRWSLCAYSHYGSISPSAGVNGYSGFTLYVNEWLVQKPDPDKQPISPCSARVTDPDASPWNYQP